MENKSAFIDEAKTRRGFLPGVKFISMTGGTIYNLPSDPKFTILGDDLFVNSTNDVMVCIYSNYRKKWAEVLDSTPKLSEQSQKLLNRANKEYPEGTKVRHYSTQNIYTITTPLLIYYPDTTSCYICDIAGNTVYGGGYWSTIIEKPQDTKEIYENNLLEEAKLKYPKGTKYINASLPAKECSIEGELKLHVLGQINNPYQITDGYGGAVFYNNKWAEIIDPKAELLKKAKELFPIGTVYNNSNLFEGKNSLPKTIVKEDYNILFNPYIVEVSCKLSNDTTYISTIYRHGKWADIISKPTPLEEFKMDKWTTKAAEEEKKGIKYHKWLEEARKYSNNIDKLADFISNTNSTSLEIWDTLPGSHSYRKAEQLMELFKTPYEGVHSDAKYDVLQAEVNMKHTYYADKSSGSCIGGYSLNTSVDMYPNKLETSHSRQVEHQVPLVLKVKKNKQKLISL